MGELVPPKRQTAPGLHLLEGGKWNDSFRLLHDIQARIDLAGGEDTFIDLLDKELLIETSGFVEEVPGDPNRTLKSRLTAASSRFGSSPGPSICW